MNALDTIQLDFDPGSLVTLQVILGFIMAGVALDLSVDDFKRLAARPWAPTIGLVCQLVLLPPLAWLTALAIAAPPSVALGMILVAACPGGNVSNFLTLLAKGRVSTSVGMTAVSTLASLVATPFHVAFWGARHDGADALVRQIALDPVDMAGRVAVLLVIPCLVGMFVAARFPALAARLRRPAKIGSILFFVVFVSIAFSKNVDVFLDHIGAIFWPVALLHALAMALGWSGARLANLDAADRRAVAIEVSIQNAGLGLVLVFAFFDGLGGMAVICAWWGIWHVIAGLTVAGLWSRRPPPETVPA